MDEREINQRAVEQICNSDRLNGKQYKKGEWLALLDGKVVAVADNLDVAMRALRAIDANPRRGMILEFGTSDIKDVIR
jgi:hypothetical protein